VKIRASVTAIEVTVEYQGYPVRGFDEALIREAKRLGGRSGESGFAVALAWRNISFSFKRMDSAEEFICEAQRLSKKYSKSKCCPLGRNRREKGR
jgi:hypothetical protein